MFSYKFITAFFLGYLILSLIVDFRLKGMASDSNRILLKNFIISQIISIASIIVFYIIILSFNSFEEPVFYNLENDLIIGLVLGLIYALFKFSIMKVETSLMKKEVQNELLR